MRTSDKRILDQLNGAAAPFAEAERERMLMAEFQNHDSVASLARAMARRIGRRARARDFIAEAKLADPPPRR